MDREGLELGLAVLAPDRVEDVLFKERVPLVLHKELHEFELLGGGNDLFAVFKDLLMSYIKRDVAVRHRIGGETAFKYAFYLC